MSELNFLIDFWCTTDKNGSMTWAIYRYEISILHYFSNENIDPEVILSIYNYFFCEQGLDCRGWKLTFWVQKLDAQG